MTKRMNDYMPYGIDADEIFDLLGSKFKGAEDNGPFKINCLYSGFRQAIEEVDSLEDKVATLQEKYHRLAVRFVEEK